MENNVEPKYHIHQIDPEYQSFYNNKKQLNGKIHEHYKQELSAIQKGQLHKLTDNRNEQQWITIMKPNEYADSDELNKPGGGEISLIDTFTANVDEPMSDTQNSYNVNSQVGTLIAQKLSNGERIRVGINGSSVVDKSNNNHTKSAFLKLVEETHLSTDALPTSVLSWKEQVKKTDVKIIEPKVLNSNSDKSKPRQDRNLVVKKLIDEEEFLPSFRKNIFLHNDSTDGSKFDRKYSAQSSHSNSSNPKTRSYQLPVEIIGTNTIGHPFQQHINEQKKIESEAAKIRKEINFKPLATNVKTNKPHRPLINLNEKNYLQLVDSLTGRYTKKTDTTANLNAESLNFFNKVNNRLETSNESNELVSLDSINDLGLNADETAEARKKFKKLPKEPINKPLINSNCSHDTSFNNCSSTFDNSFTNIPNNNNININNKSNNSLITIKTYLNSSSYSNLNSSQHQLPDSPESYHSYAHHAPNIISPRLFYNKTPLIRNSASRAKICINSPSDLGYLNNFGQSNKLQSLGGGFYYNTTNKNLPSAYYQYKKTKPYTPNNTKHCKLENSLTKYVNIVKPLTRSQTILSFRHFPVI